MSPHLARARCAALQAAIDALRLARPALFWCCDGHETTHEGRALQALQAAQRECRYELQAFTNATLTANEQADALAVTHGGMAADVARAIYGLQEEPRPRAYWAGVVMILEAQAEALERIQEGRTA